MLVSTAAEVFGARNRVWAPGRVGKGLPGPRPRQLPPCGGGGRPARGFSRSSAGAGGGGALAVNVVSASRGGLKGGYALE